MKIKNLLLAIVAFSLLVSCEKDTDIDSSKNSHRITQIIYENNGNFNKTVFSYDGEKLENIYSYEKDEIGNWVEEHKTEISYSGDNVTATNYYKSENWEISYKSEYIIQNNLMMEEQGFYYEDGDWEQQSKWTYQYSGTNISAWQRYYDENEVGKGEYIYQDEKLIEYKAYELDESDNWSQDTWTTFTYEGNNLVSMFDYDLATSDTWENDYKQELQYSGDNVSQIERFFWDSENSQWESVEYKTYSYNSYGYLSEELYDDGKKKTYEYEEGNGNAKLSMYYPENLVYGEPTLKSANVNREYVPYYQRLKNK